MSEVSVDNWASLLNTPEHSGATPSLVLTTMSL